MITYSIMEGNEESGNSKTALSRAKTLLTKEQFFGKHCKNAGITAELLADKLRDMLISDDSKDVKWALDFVKDVMGWKKTMTAHIPDESERNAIDKQFADFRNAHKMANNRWAEEEDGSEPYNS